MAQFIVPSPELIALIDRADLLLDQFGGWPTFEDAEVLALVLERGNHAETLASGDWSSRVGPSVVATFYLFDSRFGRADARRHQSRVRIRFEGVQEFELRGFNHQNPILGMGLGVRDPGRQLGKLFSVTWGGAILEHHVSFSCCRIEVVSVDPFL